MLQVFVVCKTAKHLGISCGLKDLARSLFDGSTKTCHASERSWIEQTSTLRRVGGFIGQCGHLIRLRRK
jgi:hypothetical protein